MSWTRREVLVAGIGLALGGTAIVAESSAVTSGSLSKCGASAGAPSQFCSTSSRRPGRWIHSAK